MSAVTIQEMQRDNLAMSVARAVVVANDAASADGVVPTQSLVTITEEFTDAGPAWRIEYGPRDFVRRRGGDLIVLVDQSTGEIQRVLHGQ